MNATLAAILAVLGLTLVKATPLIYAALGGVLSERSGVVNIGLEGILIAGAFTSVVVSGATGSPLLGAFAGVIAGMLLAAILAFAATRLASIKSSPARGSTSPRSPPPRSGSCSCTTSPAPRTRSLRSAAPARRC